MSSGPVWWPWAAAAMYRWKASWVQHRDLPTHAVKRWPGVGAGSCPRGGEGGAEQPGASQTSNCRSCLPDPRSGRGTRKGWPGRREGYTACQSTAAQTTVWQGQKRLHETPSRGRGRVSGLWPGWDPVLSQGWQIAFNSQVRANQPVMAA